MRQASIVAPGAALRRGALMWPGGPWLLGPTLQGPLPFLSINQFFAPRALRQFWLLGASLHGALRAEAHNRLEMLTQFLKGK